MKAVSARKATSLPDLLAALSQVSKDRSGEASSAFEAYRAIFEAFLQDKATGQAPEMNGNPVKSMGNPWK